MTDLRRSFVLEAIRSAIAWPNVAMEKAFNRYPRPSLTAVEPVNEERKCEWIIVRQIHDATLGFFKVGIESLGKGLQRSQSSFLWRTKGLHSGPTLSVTLSVLRFLEKSQRVMNTLRS
jgi:hypothetical protein